MKASFAKLCFAALALGFFCQPLGLGHQIITLSQPPLGTLKGVVTYAGRPVAGALVKVGRWDTDRIFIDEKNLYADSRGQFSVQLEQDDWDVLISCPACSPFAKKVRIEEGKESILSPKLTAAFLTQY